jgi:DNA replication protein DnaC
MNKLTRQQELESLLCAFHLPSFHEHYANFARQAEKERIDHVGYLYQLAKVEQEQRYQRRTDRLLREAKLPRGKLLDEFNLARFPHISPSLVREIAEGGCLDLRENVLIFGNPGTGKTHLSISLAREWCLRGRRVYYTSAAMLVQDLLVAKRDLRLNQVLKRFDKIDAIVIDDISYIPQDRDETDLLFQLLAECYERRSVVVTSNLAFSDWNQVFKDPMTTMAAIDRLVHHSIILELNGPSYRAEQAEKKKLSQKSSKNPDNKGNDN